MDFRENGRMALRNWWAGLITWNSSHLLSGKNLRAFCLDLSKAAAFISITVITTAMLQLALLMMYAKAKGYLPVDTWGEWQGNHGPWHCFLFFPDPTLRSLNEGLINVFNLQILSLKFSLISMKLNVSLNALVFCLEAVLLFLTVHYFYWLID